LILAPADRHSLLELLRPPPGAVLDRAVGTTFSLNLDALLIAPAAFALFETGVDQVGDLEPLGLLDALRRNADRITVFCQAGQIAPPPAHRRLLAYLEETVVPVAAPRGGVFHPKVWVLRFRGDDGTVSYRLLVLSRNLTYDRSWDSALRLESVGPDGDGQRLPALRDFVDVLPELATSPVAKGLANELRELGDELATVTWELPPGFDAATFLPIGLGDSPVDVPLPQHPERLLVISPFLGPGFLRRFATEPRTLVALPSWLQHAGAAALEGWGTFVLDDAATPDAGGDSPPNVSLADPETELSGLHAKIYLAEAGTRSVVITGSANATGAGWDRNVEAVVRLEGPTASVGSIAGMLDDRTEPITFGRLLLPYEVRDEGAEDLEDPMAGEELDALRREIATWRWTAHITAAEGSASWQVRLRSPSGVELPDDVEVRVWPISVPPAARPLDVTEGGCLEVSFPVSTEGLTAFFAFEVKRGDLATRGVLKATLEGAPEDRHQRLLAGLIGDADRLLRLLLLLLADASGAGGGANEASGWLGVAGGDRLVIDDVPLLEAMLRAVGHGPEKLVHVERLLADLRDVSEGQLVPPELDLIWRSIWAAADRSLP
jgi:hypothetical protein